MGEVNLTPKIKERLVTLTEKRAQGIQEANQLVQNYTKQVQTSLTNYLNGIKEDEDLILETYVAAAGLPDGDYEIDKSGEVWKIITSTPATEAPVVPMNNPLPPDDMYPGEELPNELDEDLTGAANEVLEAVVGKVQ